MPATPIPMEPLTLPQRLKPFALYVAPTIEWPWWALAVQSAFAGAVGAFFSLPRAHVWLFVAIVGDLVTGLACGVFCRGGWQARVMTKGGTKKVITFAVAAMAHKADWRIQVDAMTVDMGTAIAVWYLAAEGVSITENLSELGVPLPPFVAQFVQKAREAMERVSAAGPNMFGGGGPLPPA